MINRIQEFEKKDLEEINHLLSQLSSDIIPLRDQDLIDRISCDNFYLFAIRQTLDNKIIAIASVFINNTLLCKKSFVEDVVVLESNRGNGLGKELLLYIIDFCKHLNVNKIELTSRPERVGANFLYQKLGFEKRNTNYYQLNI